MGRTIGLRTLLVAALAAGTGAFLLPAPASAASVSLRDGVASLPVESEVRTGYSRSKFPHWIDADGDSCNTRYEVLIDEATTTPQVGSGCRLSGGRWLSYYDAEVWTDPADLDIDHFVPLAEAWDSGARNWTTSQRRSFANDLGDLRSLAAVTDNVNQAKGDKDPDDWMPARERCRYIVEWVAVKLRWGLSVDVAEKDALNGRADGCTNVTITYVRAI